MADAVENPLTPSHDYKAMERYWRMVDAIMAGAEAMRHAGHANEHLIPGPAQPVAQLNELQRGMQRVRWLESPYLPRYSNEGTYDYECRRRHAPFANIYSEVSDNLAGKPFGKECQLDDAEPEDLKTLADNLDGQGHNLHTVAREIFKGGLDHGIAWILVDYTRLPTTAMTQADEKAAGARPYWVHIPADRMKAVYSAFVNGQEILYHARIYEPVQRKNGYSEECVDRVRVLNREPVIDEATNEITDFLPATWEVQEKTVVTNDKIGKEEDVWTVVGLGPITIGIIPLVPFIPVGRIDASWKVKPAFHDIAHMQVEEFQQESNLKTIKELTAFPMVAGNGVSPPVDAGGQPVTVPVGPRAVLFAPMGQDGTHGAWSFIEPNAASLTFLQTDLEKHRTEMRNLGRQPLATANLTVVTTANVAMKAHSAVQAWALLLKDALEQAWIVTCKWLKQDLEPTVNVHTDFGVDFEAGTELDALLKAEGQGILSKRTVQDEMKRRGVLSDDFDADEEEKLLAEQDQGLTPEIAIDPVTGAIVQPSARPKLVGPGASANAAMLANGGKPPVAPGSKPPAAPVN